MSDVAKLAGVGTMTVSRVLNGNVHVSEETRTRVREAIAKLDYVPNEVARSLRDQRTRQIGIIVPNLQDPFFAQCAHAINLVAKERSYSTVITTSDEDAETVSIEAKRMLRRHIEGLIIVPAPGKSQLRDPEFERTPIVTLDRPVKGSSFDSVVVQNRRGARLGVEHLIAHKHRRIACLGLAGSVWTKNERLRGYCAAMKAAGLEAALYAISDSQSEMLETVRGLLGGATRPTAFFCTNNLVMRNALHALSQLNVRIPEQIAILGFDDFEMADIIKPAMTVVRQPTDELGRTAAELLFSRLNESAPMEKVKHIILPVELVIRNSCGTHRGAFPAKTVV
ncbi:MAG: LacI family DNA-binding transcriptional regulator [Acidobacteriaceae bacterium]